MNKNYLLIIAFVLVASATFSQTYDSLHITQRSNWFNPNEPVATAYGIKYNGIWGWHDGSGNEYAIVGAASGTYFIEITNPSAPVQRDYVQGRRNNCIWREIKTYQNYCYMVSDDASPNSLQIVDLSYLPDSVHVVYDSDALFERSHTIFVDGDKLYCGYVHGGSIGSSAMAVYSLANPESPTFLRSLNSDFSGVGTVHDMLVRNDTIYASCGYDGLYIFTLDAQNHFNYVNSLTIYFDQGYNHSSALTDDGHYLYFTDEVPDGMDVKVLDVSDLSNLTVVNHFHSNDDATAHNPFIKGNDLYISYYQDGLQVYDITNPVIPVRNGFYDTYWQNTPGVYPSPAYAGAWGAYPWLPSGNVIVSDMQNGLYVLDVSGLTSVSNPEPSTGFSIYPNPVKKGIDVIVNTGMEVYEARATITDATGKLVFDSQVSGKTIHIGSSGLEAGIYILNIQSEQGPLKGKFTVLE